MECLSCRGSKTGVTLAGTLLPQIMDNRGLTRVDVIRNGNRQRLDKLFASASGWCQNGDLIGNAVFTCRLLLELSELVRSVKTSPKLQTAVTFLPANLTRQVTIEEISAHCRISKPTLYRLFNDEKQCTPLKYHECLRLKYAGEVLLRLHHSVKVVSYMLGFSSPQYFATRFRKYYQCSPALVASGKLTVHCNQDKNSDSFMQTVEIDFMINCGNKRYNMMSIITGIFLPQPIFWRASLRLRRKSVHKDPFVKKLVKRLTCY